MNRLLVVLTALAGLALTTVGGSCALDVVAGSVVTPATDTVLTASRQINALAVAADGTLWAATAGGVLRWTADGTFRKWTRADGLPSHEALGVTLDGEIVHVTFPRHRAAWGGERWEIEPSANAVRDDGETCRAAWRGRQVAATLGGLRIRRGEKWQEAPLPGGKGTHISALLPRADTLWAALYGDGLWSFDGKGWRQVDIGLPPEVKEITALAARGSVLWLGTRRDGIWRRDGGRWTQLLPPDEPYDHNGQALAVFRGTLYLSTLEDGLVVRSPEGWGRRGGDALASNAPRHLAVFDGCLYVRHGNGKIDRFDGERWTLDWAKGLPRKQASAVAADTRRLYVAQWGGWSEWDGRAWKHFLDLPDLQGMPITALLPDGDRVWVGTQGKGLAEIDRANRAVRWHDERAGMPDDWITALARDGDRLIAGTFVGGLAIRDGGVWRTVPELAGENVTALERLEDGSLAVATRSGVWFRTPAGAMHRLAETAPFVDDEAQALCAVDGGLWVTTRTGLYYVKEGGKRAENVVADGGRR